MFYFMEMQPSGDEEDEKDDGDSFPSPKNISHIYLHIHINNQSDL